MSTNLEVLINDLLSPINEVRKSAESKFDAIFQNMTLNELDGLLNQLVQAKKENIKLYICAIIKKFIDEKLNISNVDSFFEYFLNNKKKFINILLIPESSKQLIKTLLVCLFSFDFIKQQELYYNKYLNILYELLLYLVECYFNKKESKDIKEIIQCLLVSEKYIKRIREYLNQTLEDFIKKFYNNIFNDYKIFVNNIINENLNDIVYFECINYYLKLIYCSNDFFDNTYNELVLNNTYNLYTFILNKLVTNEIKIDDIKTTKVIFDIIFKSNKIIISYITQFNNISLQISEKIANLFYIYVKDESIFNYICNILRNSEKIKENIEVKFLSDIVIVFYELLNLISYHGNDDSTYSSNNNNTNQISDFFQNKYWNNEKLKSLILFLIKNFLVLKPKEIMMGQDDPEEFYSLFNNSDSCYYDIKGTSGKICETIYSIYNKEMNDIYLSLENELYNLTGLEYNLLNKGQTLNDNQILIRLGLLYYYFYTDNYFSSEELDKQKWLEQILLSQIDPNIIKRKNEIFSTFLTIYVLSKFIRYISEESIKSQVFLKVMNVFICKDFDNTLLNLSCIDYIYDYLKKLKYDINIPKDFINIYISKICRMLENISSPDIHNKIIQTTNILLEKSEGNNLSINYSEIFPVFQNLWQNNSNESNKRYNNGNQLILMKSNLLKLIGIIIKKFGIFSLSENKTQNVYENFFNFIYQIIGYSINVKSPQAEFLCKDCLNIIIFIQDNFFKESPLAQISNIKELKVDLSTVNFYPYFFKTYDYIDILLANLSDSNQHFILQFGAIEQFISFSFDKQISIQLENINFIDKIIYIFNYFLNNFVNQYHFYIFCIIEYIYYVIISISKLGEENKKKIK